jgi:hypothetical protein
LHLAYHINIFIPFLYILIVAIVDAYNCCSTLSCQVFFWIAHYCYLLFLLWMAMKQIHSLTNPKFHHAIINIGRKKATWLFQNLRKPQKSISNVLRKLKFQSVKKFILKIISDHKEDPSKQINEVRNPLWTKKLRMSMINEKFSKTY